MSRRPGFDPFERRAMWLSGAFHVALFALAWASTLHQPRQIEFLTYEIELVSPPPAQRPQEEEPQPPAEELVVERPEPEPTPPEPEVEEIVPVEEPEPEPVREEPPVEEPPPEPAEEPVVTAEPDSVLEEPEETGEGLNVRMEGLRRDYPEYYDNIIQQIHRCFRWTGGGSWETTVFFYIDRQGNAEGIDFVSRSGNARFDYEALGAVECAGRGRFGPLPEDLPYDRFPIRFSFRPMGQTMTILPWDPYMQPGHP